VVNLVCQWPIIQAISRGFIMLFDMSFGVELDVSEIRSFILAVVF
jgi:hypothetical protein